MGIFDVDVTLASNRLIFEVRRDMETFQRFRQNIEPFLERHGLSDEEKRAWRAIDIKKLGELGVHPYFLPQISRFFEGSADNHNGSPAARLYAEKMNLSD